jgi:hypothetical protein
MTRNLKALGIALVAMLALSSMAVSTASALDTFTVPKAETKLEVTGGPHKLRITGTPAESECSHVKIEATTHATASSEITTESIKYTGKTGAGETENPKCESSLGDVTFDSNGCGYVLTGETTGKDKEKTDATVWIECPHFSAFEITTTVGCTILVYPQTPTEGGVTYTNGIDPTSGRKDITVTATLTGLTYSTSGTACGLLGLPAEGNTLDTNATYTIKAPEGIEYSVS